LNDDVNAIWIGDPMGPLHAACLKSFMGVGYRVILHAYSRVADAPPGVEYFDANKLMSSESIVRHSKTGSLALASDI
jgi:hypothetical protein